MEMSSRADVRLAGDSSFLMTYEYTVINGRQVRRAMTANPETRGRTAEPTSSCRCFIHRLVGEAVGVLVELAPDVLERARRRSGARGGAPRS